ncbi:hypothetical protein [Microbacterium oxydans]|uniref:Sugar ABC transporter ATPase n=1 Tax=Microbacterium oxydans TaxID=82380 RepID=A0A0F0LA79_9MICO|nr:hypothetical protein [Microbacterium oxydans]KJL30107.1 hypothetical protein RS83_01249 [Microbacterium oxydans]
MSNPDALANSQAPLPDLPHVPEEPLLPEEEETVEAREAAAAPVGGEQPETQGDEPLDAELGENGEGDLAPGDEPDTSGADQPTDLRSADE